MDRELLEKESWLQPNGEITTTTLASALTRLAHNVQRIPQKAADGISAVSILLTSLDDTRAATIIAEKIKEALQPTIDALAAATDDIRQAATNLQGGTVANANTMEEFRIETHELLQMVNSATLED
jgi:hypothetical protein